ncbi:MAG: T9SS type A sorting domain-containing protein [Chlorobi bacterium]|nr:T9SS type A sorting domain-containing protein [Chlorobiota bacterium]
MIHKLKITFILILLVNSLFSFAEEGEKIVIVIIDGARYSETLGDTTRAYTPKMWEIADEGTMIDNFYNDGQTYTSRAIPALWCGAWTGVVDTIYEGHETQYSVLPSIFEYYRKDKNAPAEDCYYILKEIESLWLPSFDVDYGPDYWPTFNSVGETDEDVAEQALLVMEEHHPNFLWVYFADVDHEGHSGIWSNYIGAIKTADSLVGVLWNAIQTDPFYKDATTMLVTNDHGRHDDQHGGFSGHGDGCDGCRHIELLAIGPDIKKNFVSYQNRYTPDMAVTASHVMDIDPAKATGEAMMEIFAANGLANHAKSIATVKSVAPNPFGSNTRIQYTLSENSHVSLRIRDFSGKPIKELINGKETAGDKSVSWDGTNNSGLKVANGVYFYTLESNNNMISGKIIYLQDN